MSDKRKKSMYLRLFNRYLSEGFDYFKAAVLASEEQLKMQDMLHEWDTPASYKPNKRLVNPAYRSQETSELFKVVV